MEFISVPDTHIIELRCGAEDNALACIIYRDENDKLCRIDFETCAANYKAEHMDASACCVGERKLDEGYFVFYTTGVKTKIIFEKEYVGNILRRHFLSGTKNIRFLNLQNRINQAQYTTFDLS